MPVDEKNNVKVFDADDQALKILGELLSNDTSRKIIKLLMKNEMYTNQIANKLDLRVSLVIHHLKKLEELSLVDITHKKIVKKGNHHRFFKISKNLFIIPDQNKKEIDEKGTLNKFFKEGTKFTFLLVIFFITFFFSGVSNGIIANRVNVFVVIPFIKLIEINFIIMKLFIQFE